MAGGRPTPPPGFAPLGIWCYLAISNVVTRAFTFVIKMTTDLVCRERQKAKSEL